MSPLAKQKQQSLRDYLHKPEFETLLEVIASQAFVREVEAVRAVQQVKAGFPAYEEQAKRLHTEAHQIRNAAELLKFLKLTTDDYQLATATP